MKIKILSLLVLTAILGGCNNSQKSEIKENKQSMEKKFEKVDPEKLNENFIQLIGNEWMLITAGNKEKFNMMTASWGTIGNLWNKPVAIIFVRPQRYTHEFMENSEYFTLSFFPEEYRKALQICGSISGRDKDKVKESGLTPYFTEENELPAFSEARIIIECKKIYSDNLKPECFLDKEIIGKNYPDSDFHTVYIGEILNVWVK